MSDWGPPVWRLPWQRRASTRALPWGLLADCCLSVALSPRQRQTIELVPLTQARYQYSGRDYSFFVYGVENQVFLSKYPSACSLL